VVKSKKPNTKGAAYRAGSENAPKILVYEALASLNRDVEQVLRDLDRLGELRIFPHRWQRKFFKTWRATLEETRAWANFEVVEVLHQREEREWVRFGRIRQRSEKTSEPAEMVVPTKSSEQNSGSRKQGRGSSYPSCGAGGRMTPS
jgi:hypothetical protein